MSKGNIQRSWAVSLIIALALGVVVGRSGKETDSRQNSSSTPKLPRPGTLSALDPRDGGAEPRLDPHHPEATDNTGADEEEEPTIGVPAHLAAKNWIRAINSSHLSRTGEAVLHHDIVEFFGIDEVEKASIESVLTGIGKELHDYETASVKRVSEEGAEKTTLEITVSEEFGKRMSDTLRTGLTNSLGAARARSFEAISQTALRDYIGAGGMVKQVTFTPKPDREFRIAVTTNYPDGSSSRLGLGSIDGIMHSNIDHFASFAGDEVILVRDQ